MGGPKVTR